MSDVTQKRLGDYLTLQRGFDITKNEQSDGIYPVVSSSGTNSYHDKFKVNGPGVVIGRKGTLGTTFYISSDFWPHDTSLWIKDFKGNHPKFVYYYLKKLPLEKLDSGSANPTLNRNIVHLLDAKFPDLSTQKKIAKVLSDLDAKIELNNKINQEMEAMAKLIYDYWFVQFDFPISKEQAIATGKPKLEGKPYKSSGGKMVYNEELKREIPEGWEVKELGDMVHIINDNILPSALNSKTAYIGLEHIPRKTIHLTDWETSKKVGSQKCQFKIGDILFGKIRPYFHKVGVAPVDGITSTDTIVMRVISKKHHGLILQSVFSDVFVDTATNSSTGSKMPRANWDILKKYPIIIPSVGLLDLFEAVSKVALSKSKNNIIQNKKLTELRDWLLPMLMNGQVKV